jgi:hypothetical protein
VRAVELPFLVKKPKKQVVFAKIRLFDHFWAGKDRSSPPECPERRAAALVGRVGGDGFFSHGLNTDETRIFLPCKVA